VDHAELEDELDGGALLVAANEPAVVAVARPCAVDPRGQLGAPRRALEVAGARHASHLRADEDRVANVLQRLGADHEVEAVVGERPGLAAADVALDPGLRTEALPRGIGMAVEPTCLVGQQVDDPVGALQRRGPAADVQQSRVVGQLAADPGQRVRAHQASTSR
jgi:hypothetical protein